MIEPKKLKVAELREELKNRGLETKGNKAQLVKRLEKAIKKEDGESEGRCFLLNEVALTHGLIPILFAPSQVLTNLSRWSALPVFFVRVGGGGVDHHCC